MSMFDPEAEQFEQFEGEEEVRGRRSSGRRAPARAVRPRPLPVKRPLRGRRATGGQVSEPRSYPDDSGEPASTPSERVRWLQFCLNRAVAAQLPVDGVISPAMRSVMRTFQRQQGLPVSGIAGPDTEEALKNACRDQPSGSSSSEPASEFEYETEGEWPFAPIGRLAQRAGQAAGRAAAMLGGTPARIIDLTAQADKSQRKKVRDPKKVYALVLHQMACCFKPRDPLKRFLSIGSHYAILPDGRILQLHPASALVWASNGFNPGSVAVEFAGNFPDTSGRWWKGEKYGRNRPTAAQLEAGRALVRHLVRTLGITTILAHRQSSNDRTNDPGPDIWYHVGQWAVEKLGLRDGGPGYRHPSEGKAIPQEWRDWGRRGTPKSGELGEFGPQEAELWRGSPEGPLRSESEFGGTDNIRRLQSSLNHVLGLRLAVDGILGPKTRSAIRNFQRRRGLRVDGVPSPQMMRMLGGPLGQRTIASLVGGSGTCPVPPPVEIAWEQANPAGRIETRSEGGLNVLILSNFAVGSAALKPEHIRELRRIAPRSGVGEVIVVEGHSSCSGVPARKRRISEQRAAAVAEVLRRGGTPTRNLEVSGSSDSRPRVPNTTAENMSHNRRVELQLGTVV